MKVNFRQGIAKYQQDSNGTPIFLQRSNDGQYVGLVVAPTPTLIVFAHRDATYLVEESKSVPTAWGPLTGTATKYLYWDVSMLNGALTRGFTLRAPIYSSIQPQSPLLDQHWFDTVNRIFRVWNGKTWVERVRCFAGMITSNAVITPQPLGSQAGINGNFEAGQIILDAFGTPLRQRNPADPPSVNAQFVTTTTWLNVLGTSNTQVRVEQQLMYGMAIEEMARFSVVQLRPGKRLVLARSTDYTTRAAGLILNDMNENDAGAVVTSGLVQNASWNWPASSINRPIFFDSTGQLTITPPQTGVVQQLGFVYDTTAIWIDIKQPVVLDIPTIVDPDPPPPPPGAPTADFIADVTTGNAPFSVTFTSTSPGADTFEWDFENNGFWDAVGPSVTHLYSAPGVYTVRHRASNINGADVRTRINYITVLQAQQGPLFTNLGFTFGGPAEAVGGVPFSMQALITNDGLLTATSVTRSVVIRSNNGKLVQVSGATGATITTTGNGTGNNPYITTVTWPILAVLTSGDTEAATFMVQSDPSSSAVLFTGTVSSPETDSTINDNSAAFEVRIRT